MICELTRDHDWNDAGPDARCAKCGVRYIETLHPRSVSRRLRDAYLDFESVTRQIEAIRLWMPHEMRSKSPVLDNLYRRADLAIVYMMRNGLAIWPKD